MTEEQTETPTTDAPEQEETREEASPTETVEFWKQKAREQEKRAKANADAARKLAEIEESTKTEQEKLAERLAEAEKAAATATAEALRFRVASKHGISDEDAELFLTGSDEETLMRQAERLAAKVAADGKPRPPKPDPNQGRSNDGPASTADQFAATVSKLI